MKDNSVSNAIKHSTNNKNIYFFFKILNISHVCRILGWHRTRTSAISVLMYETPLEQWDRITGLLRARPIIVRDMTCRGSYRQVMSIINDVNVKGRKYLTVIDCLLVDLGTVTWYMLDTYTASTLIGKNSAVSFRTFSVSIHLVKCIF